MGARCYLCAFGHTQHVDEAPDDEAIGACKLCGILACRGHGKRNPNRPAWHCVLCMPALVTTAGIVRSNATDPVRDVLKDAQPDLVADARQIDSVDDFLDRYGYDGDSPVRALVSDAQDLASAWRHQDWEPGFAHARWMGATPAPALAMVAFGVLLADRLALPEHELMPVLRGLLALRVAGA